MPRRWGPLLALLAVSGAAWLWLCRPLPEASPRLTASVPRALPHFQAVEVAAQPGKGLSLTGQVKDARGRPVPSAEVSLVSSAERSLSSLKCDACGQRLLSCTHVETLHQVEHLLAQGQGGLQARLQTRTDAQGRFAFEGLAGVSFTLWARAEGLGLGVKERAAPGEAVELFLPALRSLKGRVHDDAGRPLLGARVFALSPRVPLPFEVQSASDGTFVFTGLGEGPFYVLARAEGFLPAAVAQVEAGPRLLQLALARPRALEIRVTREGKPTDATVRLTGDHLERALWAKGGWVRQEGLSADKLSLSAQAGKYSALPRTVLLNEPVTQVELELVEAGQLWALVVDEQGQPVPQPELLLRSAQGELLRTFKVETGALVSLGPLAFGDYGVEASARGFQTTRLPAKVGEGERTLELTLLRATLISGRVLDVYGRPASGVSVFVKPTGEVVGADEAGRFEAQVPSAGLYTLHAHHSEWGGGELQVTAPAEQVELALEPRASVEVTALSQGRRVEGADAVLWLERETLFRSDRPSGADGLIPMRGMPPGSYWLVVQHPDYLASPRQKIQVQESQTLAVSAELQPGAVLRGLVQDERGAPIPGVTLNVSPRATGPVTSDARGVFEFKPLDTAKTYRVEAHPPSYDVAGEPEGKPGGPPVTVVLKRRALYRGRVVSEEGQPLKRFRLDDLALSSPDGRFEVALPTSQDRLIVTLEAPGYEPVMLDRPASPELGDLVLQRAPSFSGVVRDSSGAPVAEAVLSCDVCESSVLSGADGRFTLPSPHYVAQFVVFAKKGRQSASLPVPRADASGLTLVLQSATRLSGTVYSAEGKPVPGHEIDAIHLERGEPVTMVTGMDGRYSAEVAPGSYRFSLGQGRDFAGVPALLAQVSGASMQLDLGPGPSTESLTVWLTPERGRALWVIPGERSNVGNPPVELMRTPLAQMIYQPAASRVTLRGLKPGRYTLVWAQYHVDTPGGPVLRTVEVPSRDDIRLSP